MKGYKPLKLETSDKGSDFILELGFIPEELCEREDCTVKGGEKCTCLKRNSK